MTASTMSQSVETPVLSRMSKVHLRCWANLCRRMMTKLMTAALDRHTRMSRLRVGMSGAGRMARSARALRTLGTRGLDPDRRTRGTGCRRHAVRDGRFDHRARLVAVAPRGYAEDASLDAKVYEACTSGGIRKAAGRRIRHPPQPLRLPAAHLQPVDRTPVVTTVHGFSSERIVPVYRAYNSTSHLVAISAADRRADSTTRPPSTTGSRWRSSHFARAGGVPVVLRTHPFGQGRPRSDRGGSTDRPSTHPGWHCAGCGLFSDRRSSHTWTGKQIQYIGSVGPAQRDALFGGARALLHLVRFDEPFGLSVVEAMATGTPVIAFQRGSMPELIDGWRQRVPGGSGRYRGLPRRSGEWMSWIDDAPRARTSSALFGRADGRRLPAAVPAPPGSNT